MSITNVNARADATGNGSVAVYPYTFRILAESDIEVWTNLGTGGEVQLGLNVDYTVAASGINVDAGGTITLTAGNLANGTKISILRIVRNPAISPVGLDITQPTDIENQGPYDPTVIEQSLDRATMVDQGQEILLDQSLKIPLSEAGTKALTTIPLLADRKGKVLGFDASTGNPTAVSPVIPTTALTLGSGWTTTLSASIASWATAFIGASTTALGMNALGISAGWAAIVASTPATWLVNFTGRATAALARGDLGFGTAAKFVVEGDMALLSVGTGELIAASVTAAKLAAPHWHSVRDGFSAFPSVAHPTYQVTYAATNLSVEQWIGSALGDTADLNTVNANGAIYGYGDSYSSAPALTSQWISIWIVSTSGGIFYPAFSATLDGSSFATAFKTSYPFRRRVGFCYLDGSGNITPFRIDDNWYTHMASVPNGTGTVAANIWETCTVEASSVPVIETEIEITSQVSAGTNNGAGVSYHFRPTNSTHNQGVLGAWCFVIGSPLNNGIGAGATCRLWTDINGQFQSLLSSIGAVNWNGTSYIYCTGFRIPTLRG